MYGGKFLSIMFMAFPFYLSWRFFYVKRMLFPFFYKGNMAVVGLYIFLYALLSNLYDGYSVTFSRVPELIYSQSLSAFLADFFLFLVIVLLTRGLVPVWPLLLVLVAQIDISVAWSFLTHKIYALIRPPLPALLIHGEYQDEDLLLELKKLPKQFALIGSVPLDEYLQNAERYLHEAKVIFLVDIRSHERNKIVKTCAAKHISVYLFPKVSDMLISGAKPTYSFYRPLIEISPYNPSLTYLFIKRCMDIAISLSALTVLSPLMLVVALLIRRDGGPVFYKQERLTKDGKVFHVFKFRSMVVDAERDGVARLSSGQSDSRVTPVGRVIRRYRIDELAQLLNVLRGEMSIVGPRPERPELTLEYEKSLPEFSLRLQAKAGLTGYAQVHGKYNTTPYEKLLMDLEYMAHPGLLTDLEIIFSTIKILFIPESTEGVGEKLGEAVPPENADENDKGGD